MNTTPIPAELTFTGRTDGLWCPYCALPSGVELRSIATRRDRPDLPPLARGRSIECDECERDLIESEIELSPEGQRVLFQVVE